MYKNTESAEVIGKTFFFVSWEHAQEGSYWEAE